MFNQSQLFHDTVATFKVHRSVGMNRGGLDRHWIWVIMLKGSSLLASLNRFSQ